MKEQNSEKLKIISGFRTKTVVTLNFKNMKYAKEFMNWLNSESK